jgi:hypothetical protein
MNHLVNQPSCGDVRPRARTSSHGCVDAWVRACVGALVPPSESLGLRDKSSWIRVEGVEFRAQCLKFVVCGVGVG